MSCKNLWFSAPCLPTDGACIAGDCRDGAGQLPSHPEVGWSDPAQKSLQFVGNVALPRYEGMQVGLKNCT